MDSALKNYIAQQLQDSIDTKTRVLRDESLMAEILQVTAACIRTYQNGGKVLLAGNGGSAADAQHIAAEFVSRFNFDRPGLPSIALSTDTSMLTAISNDYGYENVFRRQLQANGKAGDLFIGITTSGRSPNIVAALAECKKLGITAVGLTGSKGRELKQQCEYCIAVPSTETPRIQETHIAIGHIICAAVEEALFGQALSQPHTVKKAN